MPKYRNIVYSTDLSRNVRTAGRHAIDLARQNDTRLYLLHVLDDRYMGAEFLAETLDMKEVMGDVRSRVQRELDAMISRPSFRGLRVEAAVRKGNPAEEILRFAEEKKAGLIVLGTHARTGLEHVLLGTTAEKVVRNSPVPVLTVKEGAPARKGTGR